MADAAGITIWTTAAASPAPGQIARMLEDKGFSVAFHESPDPPGEGADVIFRWVEAPGDWRDEARGCLGSGTVRTIIVAAPGAAGVEHVAADPTQEGDDGGCMIGVDSGLGAEVVAATAEIVLSCAGRIAEAGRNGEGLSDAQEKFLAIASHDLRTPISTLRLLNDLFRSNLDARSDRLTPKELSQFEELLDIMARNLEKMEAFVEDILSAWRVFRGRPEAERGPVSLNAVVEDVVAGLFPSAMRKDIALDLLADPSIERIVAERRSVGQVAENLVQNAVKYTPKGGTVTVFTRAGEGGATLEVADTGAGIPEDERGRLFERFSRGSARATGGEPSTGLGLYICREIVERHGGRIWFEPRGGASSEGRAAPQSGEEVGSGSRFLVFWPYSGAASGSPGRE
ncbi:MAG: sensor histidine kinase [Planctomycetota bacterium]|jgi:signal transduction histidine kinase